MLPSALLDLVSLRLSIRVNPAFINARASSRIRRVHQLTTQHTSHSTNEGILLKTGSRSRDRYDLKVQQAKDQVQAVSELEARVAALKEAADISIQTAESKLDGPYFPDAALREIYKDLLAYPEPSPLHEQPAEIDAATVIKILQVMRERLPDWEAAAESHASSLGGLSERLQTRMSRPSHPARPDSEINLGARISEDIATWDRSTDLRELISRFRVILDTLWYRWPRAGPEYTSPELKITPFRLLSDKEWRALSQACLSAEDPSAAEAVLDLMRHVDLPPSDEQCDEILNYFAKSGMVEEADAYLVRLSLGVPRERQRDLLMKARVRAQQIDEACHLLHTYETRLHPAPMKSYTRIIQALLDQRGPGSTQQVAQAWDLFAHMRYVAHPVPDAFLYSTMIRAAPEPVRALDLFTEMTVEQRIVPDKHAYTAVIRACARSKEYALHAFRIAREMLNSHRDAHGEIPVHLRPDMHTFLGLLEAAKRIGDLSRARWILAEMAQSGRGADAEGGDSVYVNQKALTHLFHAYASYRPPFRREAVSIVREKAEVPPDDKPSTEPEPSPSKSLEAAGLARSRALPQSRQEVIREVTQLWQRVLEDRETALSNPDAHPPPVFGLVQLDSVLLNAYQAVHYAHSAPSEAYKVYDTLFEPLGITRDAWTYVLALEAYANGAHKNFSQSELSVALSAARSVWVDWSRLEDGGNDKLHDPRGPPNVVEARLVERAWSAMIRLLTLTDNLDEAEGFLRRFVERYPPEHVKQPSPADPRRSNRIRLYDERPLIRLTEPSAVPEDRITPFLTFTDVALLHSRAILMRRMRLVDYMKWALSAYEGSLRRRRQAQHHSR